MMDEVGCLVILGVRSEILMWRVRIEARQASRKWYNIRLKHERRKAHVETGNEVFGCIPHGRGAFQDWPSHSHYGPPQYPQKILYRRIWLFETINDPSSPRCVSRVEEGDRVLREITRNE